MTKFAWSGDSLFFENADGTCVPAYDPILPKRDFGLVALELVIEELDLVSILESPYHERMELRSLLDMSSVDTGLDRFPMKGAGGTVGLLICLGWARVPIGELGMFAAFFFARGITVLLVVRKMLRFLTWGL